MIFRTRRLALVASMVALLGARAALAGPPSDQLRGSIDRVLSVLGDPALRADDRVRERRTAIRHVANDIFDFNEISKRSLGRHWQGRTAVEQEEFVQLLTELLERSYMSKIELYAGEKVAIVGESLDGDLATVRTKIVSKGIEIPVDYRMFRQGDQWRAYDVAIEGVSLVASYRSQFNAIIQKSSYQELVNTMKAKQDERSQVSGVARKDRRGEGPSPVGPAAGPADPSGVRHRQSP